MWMRTSNRINNSFFQTETQLTDSSCHSSVSLLGRSCHCRMMALQGIAVEVFAAWQSKSKENESIVVVDCVLPKHEGSFLI